MSACRMTQQALESLVKAWLARLIEEGTQFDLRLQSGVRYRTILTDTPGWCPVHGEFPTRVLLLRENSVLACAPIRGCDGPLMKLNGLELQAATYCDFRAWLHDLGEILATCGIDTYGRLEIESELETLLSN